MRVWFLNVGHGDCTVIEHASGRLTMIDINNSQHYDNESRQELIREEMSKGLSEFMALLETYKEEKIELCDPIDFFKKQFPGREIFRFILTHPDLDHMRGLKKLFSEIGVANFWDTANTKVVSSFRSEADKEDWEFYQELRNGHVPEVSVRNYTRGASVWAMNAPAVGGNALDQGDGIYILSPTPELVQKCNISAKSNDLSMVLMVILGGRRFIFPGDAEAPAWDEMVGYFGANLKADVLKASHHGRDSGYHLAALQNIKPEASVISVGRKPNTDAHRKYSGHCNTRSTRHFGNIMVDVAHDGTWQWYVARNYDV